MKPHVIDQIIYIIQIVVRISGIRMNNFPAYKKSILKAFHIM